MQVATRICDFKVLFLSSQKPLKRRPQIADPTRVVRRVCCIFLAYPKAPVSDTKRLPKPTPPEISPDDPRQGRRDHPRRPRPSQASEQTCEQRPLHLKPLPSKQASKQAGRQASTQASKQAVKAKHSNAKQGKQANTVTYDLSPSLPLGLAQWNARSD